MDMIDVFGRVTGERLVAQLLELGFSLDDGRLLDPGGELTGFTVLNETTIEAPPSGFGAFDGFETLVCTLQESIIGLQFADLRMAEAEGEAPVAYHAWWHGAWYRRVIVDCYVRADVADSFESQLAAELDAIELPTSAALLCA